MVGAASLLSVLGAAASTAGVSAGDQPNSVAQYREAITNGFSQASNSVLGVFTRIKPTITVRQGMPIKVFVARDLYFDPAAISQSQGIEVIP
jgi:type IV secretory pathway VirB10-like protein